MLTTILNFKKKKLYVNSSEIYFVLQLIVAEVNVEDLETFSQIDFDVVRMESKPWKLRAAPYDVPWKLSMCSLQLPVMFYIN